LCSHSALPTDAAPVWYGEAVVAGVHDSDGVSSHLLEKEISIFFLFSGTESVVVGCGFLVAVCRDFSIP
jgi:hypothetical protein